jgi:hypothetical protein
MNLNDLEPIRESPPHLTARSKPDAPGAGAAGRVDDGWANALLKLQRLAGNSSVDALLVDEPDQAPVGDVVGSGLGSPLDSRTRALMESRLGHDFGDVRIHTGHKADLSARSINAQAYTAGTDVVFRSGQYAPDTATGLHTLAHELTHVIQQKAGPVSGTPIGDGIRLSDPSDAFEQAAERNATAAMSGGPLAAEAEQQTAQALVAQRADEEEDQVYAEP